MLGFEAPSRERPGALVDVVFGVVVHSHGEELQELAPPVLVGRPFVVVLVVEPEDHCGVFGCFDEKPPVAAHAVLSEQRHLVGHLAALLDLRDGGGEYVMPEQRHLLLQRPRGVEHPVHPVGLDVQADERALRLREVAVQLVHVEFGLRLRVQELLDGRVVALFDESFELVASCAEAGATHQVGHQSEVVVGHRRSPCGRTFPSLKRAAWDSQAAEIARGVSRC